MKVVLLATRWVGEQIACFLRDEIVRLYVDKDDANHMRVMYASGVPSSKVRWATQLDASDLREVDFDFLITVYWSRLVPKSVYSLARKGTINFHPALLPLNRGWHPHVYNIIEGTEAGVSLHELEETADTGPIWASKQVKVLPTDTAKELYDRLAVEIVDLFTSKWDDIKNGRITPTAQTGTPSYHGKKLVNDLDHVHDVNLIKLLRARSFGHKGYAYIEENGKRIYLNLRLSESIDFGEMVPGGYDWDGKWKPLGELTQG